MQQSWQNPSAFLLAYTIPLSALLGALWGGVGFYFTFAISFVLIPTIDQFIGHASADKSSETEEARRKDPRFSYILYAFLPVSILTIAGGLWLSASGKLAPWELLGLALSSGIVSGGIGINIAHELCHRPQALPRFVSYSLLVLVGYGHFAIEHPLGHHHKVATPDDPATSRAGESLYHFLPRTLWGSWLSADALEEQRLRKRRLPSTPWANRTRRFSLISLAFALAIAVFLGRSALLYYLGQSLIAVLILETINYIEHYGLLRQRLPTGAYEPVATKHSWNANHLLSNLFLFRLQRHSDHHANAQRPYQILRHSPESPQLPYGYPTMVLLALVPPLWRRVMDSALAGYRTRHA